MKIGKEQLKNLNMVCGRYSKWLAPKDVSGIYDELQAMGVVVPAWSSWENDRAHPFEVNGEECENSLFVFTRFTDLNRSENKDEYNIYFS